MEEDDNNPVYSKLRDPVALLEQDLIYDWRETLYDVQLVPGPTSSGSDTQLRPFTQQELIDAKPHPDALFCAESMSWVCLIPTGHITAEQQPPPPGCNKDQFPIYETSDPFHQQNQQDGQLNDTDIRIQVAKFTQEGHRTSTLFEGPLRLHKQHSSGLVHDDVPQRSFVSAVIPSSIGRYALEELRQNRADNPPIGQTPEQSCLGAFKTLIRILSNASRNDQRYLPLNSPTIQNKIGTDPVAMGIFKSIGLQRSTMDDGRDALQATQHDQLLTLRNLLEVITWWHCFQSTATALDLSGIGLQLQHIHSIDTPELYARRYLHWDTTRFQQPQHLLLDHPHPLLFTDGQRALQHIGSGRKSSDAVIEKMYRVNSQQIQMCSTSDQVRQQAFVDLFSALELVRQEERPQSDVLQTLCVMERSQGAYTNDELQQSYSILQASQQASDQTLAQKYVTLIDSTTSHSDCRRARDALGMIKASRCEPALLQEAYNRPLKLSIEEAYTALQIPSEDPNSVEDNMIITLYEMHAGEETNMDKISELRRALHVIAENRNSKLLKQFHQTGDSNVTTEANLDLPTGLNNIGNTCYLNSVLQYFFAIRPLRQQVLSSHINEGNSVGSVGGRKISQHEVKRSVEFVSGLKELFRDMICTNALAVTPSRELAYMALVSTRFDAQQEEEGQEGVVTEEPEQIDVQDGMKDVQEGSEQQTVGDARDSTLGGDAVDDVQQGDRMEEDNTTPPDTRSPSHKRKSMHDEHPPSTTEEHTQISVQVLDDDGISTPPLPSTNTVAPPPPLPPRPNASPTSAASAAVAERRNSLMTLGAQQDVSECLDNVLFQIEVALGQRQQSQSETDSVGQVSRLFTGKTRQVVTNADSPSSGTTHIKNEIFTILPIDVSEEENGRDIYDGLDGFFEEEILSSDTTHAGVKRSVTLLEPPPILQIQLQRVQYDRVRGAYKSQAKLEMSDELYMDRYLDFSQLVADPEELNSLNDKRQKALELRKEMASMRARLRELKPKFGDSCIDTLKKTQAVLKGLGQVKSVSTLQKEYTLKSRSQSQSEEKSLIDLSSSDEDDGDDNREVDTLSDLLSPSLSLDTFLKTETTSLTSEITTIEHHLLTLKTRTESLWSNHHSCKYKLISIFKHRGEASHGHYFLEQRKEGEQWFKYNDSVVQDVSLKEVLEDSTGATPYLLSYVRVNEEGEGLFESLKREPLSLNSGGESSGVDPSDGNEDGQDK